MSTQADSVRDAGQLLTDVLEATKAVDEATTTKIAEEMGEGASNVRDALYRLQERGKVEKTWDLSRPHRYLWQPTGDGDD